MSQPQNTEPFFGAELLQGGLMRPTGPPSFNFARLPPGNTAKFHGSQPAKLPSNQGSLRIHSNSMPMNGSGATSKLSTTEPPAVPRFTAPGELSQVSFPPPPLPSVSKVSSPPPTTGLHKVSVKRKPNDLSLPASRQTLSEPMRKVHVTEDVVADTLSQLFISNPKAKIARRDLHRDVAEAMNIESLNELESKFHSQANIFNEDLYLPPPSRSRKLPNRQPQLKLSLHEDFRSMKASNIIPESILAKYRAPSRSGSSTALVLWRPPGGIIPDLIASTWKAGGKSRSRSYSEVTSTPYSSNENLVDSEMFEIKGCGSGSNINVSVGMSRDAGGSPVSAEAPELTSSADSPQEESPGGTLQRRNSAPELGEPLPFLDDGSMEL